MVALTYHAATHRDLELLIFLPDSTSCMLGLQICAITLKLESSCFFFFPKCLSSSGLGAIALGFPVALKQLIFKESA